MCPMCAAVAAGTARPAWPGCRRAGRVRAGGAQRAPARGEGHLGPRHRVGCQLVALSPQAFTRNGKCHVHQVPFNAVTDWYPLGPLTCRSARVGAVPCVAEKAVPIPTARWGMLLCSTRPAACCLRWRHQKAAVSTQSTLSWPAASRPHVPHRYRPRTVSQVCSDPQQYATLRAEPDFQSLGKKLGKAVGAVGKAIKVREHHPHHPTTPPPASGPCCPRLSHLAVPPGCRCRCVAAVRFQKGRRIGKTGVQYAFAWARVMCFMCVCMAHRQGFPPTCT